MLVALPSFGSRVEDGTLAAQATVERAFLAVHASSPLTLNPQMLDVSAVQDKPPAAITPNALRDVTAPLARSSDAAGIIRRAAPAALPSAPMSGPSSVARGTEVPEVRIAPATELALRPPPRPGTLYTARAESGRNRVTISTHGVIVPRPVSRLAPVSSAHPPVRPAGLSARVVRHDSRWLRGIALREIDAQEHCLKTAIYHEARGESLKGQFAVAEVIMNRVTSRKFPNTICAVVYQGAHGQRGGCQFSFACDGRSEAMPNRTAAAKAQRIAQVMAGGGQRSLTDGALFFHTTQVNPPWARAFTKTSQIGAHLFYRS